LAFFFFEPVRLHTATSGRDGSHGIPFGETETVVIKGRDLVTGIPKTVEVNSDEIRESIQEQIDSILETVKVALEQTPPELAGDIVDRGIVLTGGGVLLKNIEHFLRL